MSTHTEAGEPRASHIRRSRPLYSGIMIVMSALGLYLLLAMLAWAAPQPNQTANSLQMDWLLSPAATAIVDVMDTNILYLPVVHRQATPIPFPPIPGASYTNIPVNPYFPRDHVDSQHPDLNLEMRGYTRAVSPTLGLVDISGPTDQCAPPRLANLFSPARLPTFSDAYQVYDWDWLESRPGNLLVSPPVTLIWMAAGTNEIIYLPNRIYNPNCAGPVDIYQEIWYAQVLYATDDQITFVYTRLGNVTLGYVVHIVNIWVDPLLVARYQEGNAAGRYNLPGLTYNQAFGRAKAGGIGVAIRDNGTFMDPRSRKDWWPGW